MKFPAFPTLLLLLVTPLTLHAIPRSFDDLKSAVEFARARDSLILLALSDEPNGAEAGLVEILRENRLRLTDEAFVTVACSPSNPAHAQLFTTRFETDPAEAPILVVTDGAGTKLGALSGLQPLENYTKLVRDCLLKTGRPIDTAFLPAEPAPNPEDELIEGSGEVFRLKKGDLMGKAVAITESRTWTFKNGTKLFGALLEAKGTTGTLVLQDKTKRQIDFNELVPFDVQYLQLALSQ